jgi:hypothetical protein
VYIAAAVAAAGVGSFILGLLTGGWSGCLQGLFDSVLADLCCLASVAVAAAAVGGMAVGVLMGGSSACPECCSTMLLLSI